MIALILFRGNRSGGQLLPLNMRLGLDARGVHGVNVERLLEQFSSTQPTSSIEGAQPKGSGNMSGGERAYGL